MRDVMMLTRDDGIDILCGDNVVDLFQRWSVVKIVGGVWSKAQLGETTKLLMWTCRCPKRSPKRPQRRESRSFVSNSLFFESC